MTLKTRGRGPIRLTFAYRSDELSNTNFHRATDMHFILRDIDSDLALGWAENFGPYSNVSFGVGDIRAVETDAVVCPINQRGELDGVLGGTWKRRFGRQTRDRMQKRAERFPVRVPLGQAILVKTDDAEIRWLIGVVTGRSATFDPFKVSALGGDRGTPQPREGKSQADVVYLATKSVLECASQTEGLGTLAMTGLGTGRAGVDPWVCADRMFQAFVDADVLQSI